MAQIPFKTKIVNGQLQLVRPFQFINKKIEKEFLNLIEEAQNFSGAAGTAPEKYKVSNIAKKYKLGVSTLERILRDLRQTEKIAGSTDPLTVSTERAANTLVYVDGTQGWLLKNN